MTDTQHAPPAIRELPADQALALYVLGVLAARGMLAYSSERDHDLALAYYAETIATAIRDGLKQVNTEALTALR